MRVPLLATTVAVLLLAAPPPAWARETEAPGRVDPDARYRLEFDGRIEPADLAAGQSGTLVVVLKLGAFKITDGNLAWRALETEGVAYGEIEVTPQSEWETEWGPEKGWKKDDVELRVPITLADDAAEDVRPGLWVKYGACDDVGCGMPKPWHVTVGRPDEAGGWQLPPAIEDPAARATLTIDEKRKALVLRVEPNFGYHLYGTSVPEPQIPVAVESVAQEGVTWGEADVPADEEIHEPFDVRIPYEAEGVDTLSVGVTWQGCTATNCIAPFNKTLAVTYRPARAAVEVVPAPKRTTPTPAPAGGVEAGDPGVDVAAAGAGADTDYRFPVVENDALVRNQSGNISKLIREKGIFFALFFVFITGAGLTFTPCVFPIIPLVVASIAGGKQVSRGRLARLLGMYTLGLCLTFALVGVISAQAGKSMSAVFSNDYAIIGFSVFFVLMAFGMLGLFELQPPQWLMRIQGSAQSRGGSLIGALMLGALGAVLASPCTGPVIAGMAGVVATEGDPALGFVLFFLFGLGMGVVFSAFGMMNMALRPGPWMVWVRYVFGMLLFGAALYYLRNSEIVSHESIWIIGVPIALLAGISILAPETSLGVFRKVRDAFGQAVRGRLTPAAIGVTAMFLGALVGVWFLQRPPTDPLKWHKVTSLAELRAEVDRAVADGQPVVADVWAQWCAKCKEFDHLFSESPKLRKKFESVRRVKIDLTDAENSDIPEIRDALGIPRGIQPFLVFLDQEGRVRRNADIVEYTKDKGEIHKRLDLILANTPPPAAASASAN